MTYPDLETQWRQGCSHSLRRMPRHWTLTDPDAAWDSARGMFWLIVKTLVAAALVVVAYALVAS